LPNGSPARLLCSRCRDAFWDHWDCFHRSTPHEPPVTGYGLGIEEIAVARLLQSYGHLGYHCGTMSAMLYLPKLKASLVVLQYGVAFGLLAVLLLRWLSPILGPVLLLILTTVL